MTGEGINPFHYSGPVSPVDLVDRVGERSALMDLAHSANNARLTAPRRYGKTSLLRATLARAGDEGWASVYVDFFGVLTQAEIAQRIESAYLEQLRGRLGQWIAGVVRTLKPVARLGGGPVPGSVEIGAGGATRADITPLTERLALPKRLYERDGKRVLVAFDEFQDVLQAGAVDSVIRSEIQHHGDAASYIFAGSHVGMMAELFADRRRAFYAQAKPIPLPPLDLTDLAEHVVDRFAESGKDIGTALGPLLDATEGHPQRAMLLAHTVWDRTAMGARADEVIWAEAYTEVLDDFGEEARSLWTRTPAVHRQVLASIAHNNAGLYARANGNPRGGSTAAAVDALVANGEIFADPDTSTGYQLVDPLLAAWIRAGRPSR